MTISTASDADALFSYYRKVSSEAGYDKFILYIDGAQEDEASGTEDWTYFSTILSAGSHTIRFSYEKDYSQSGGQDCAWIDNVTLPCSGIMVIEDMVDPTDVGVHAYAEIATAVYPNPATQYVNVSSEEPMGKLVLLDLNGRVVKTVSADGNRNCQVGMDEVSVGVYLLQVTYGDNQVRVFKVIKR